MRWSLGDHGDVEDRFIRHFAVYLEGLITRGHVWETGPGNGAAVWIPPDGVEAYHAQLRDPRMTDMTDDGGQRFDVFWDWVASESPHERVWHLDAVAVPAELRGRGIARALIEHGVALARDDGAATALETGNPANVPLYEKLGFDVVAERSAPDGGPLVWFMRRDP